ncbi:MAG: MmgE/PrpD family protein [Gammaproteobacteria bacterium]|nr:MmgE/PrpD family protein [Gammaproteobacteria bacterium]MDH3412823.1 MmgE/PrpD family protein [Gammaproteobacteria bacterium]
MKVETLPKQGAAQELIGFCQALSLEAVPGSVVNDAKWCLLDSLGCALFGSQQPWARIMAEEMLAEGSKGHSSILGRNETLAAPAAALCNGTATHGFELDDLLDEAIVHPGAIVVPAALAAAEAIDAPSLRLLLGIIAGYETINRVGLAIGVEPARRGHHQTALAGPLGSVIAAGVVMNLSREQLTAAVGLACSTSSGTKSFAAGSGGGMMKRMHAGRAAEAGVRMAQLAARGFTAPPTALDGRFGLLEVLSGTSARPEQLVVDLGKRWAVEQVYVKVYPCCAWIQATVQQLVAMRGARPVKAEEVKNLRIGVCSYAARNNGNVAPPDTMGAQYSLPYCAALAVTADPREPAMYFGDQLDNPARRELARRLEIVVDPEMEAAYPKHYGARVHLELANGETHDTAVLDPHGMPSDPCSDEERLTKFRLLVRNRMSDSRASQVFEAVNNVENVNSVRNLTRLLRSDQRDLVEA